MSPAKSAFASIIVVGALAAAGCTTLPESPEDIAHDRAAFHDFKSAFAGTDQLAAHRYQTVMIEPFAVASGRASRDASDSAAELQQALAAAIEAERPVTTQAGPNVLRVEVVIKDIDSSSPALNVVSSLIAFVPFDTGGIAADIHLRDGASGALLATVHANEKATPFHLSGSFSRYGHAKNIVQKWGREVAALL